MSIDEPDHDMIDLQFSEYEIKMLNTFSGAIRNLVNLGTHLIKREIYNKNYDVNTRSVVFALSRRMIEILDASSILIREGSIVPCFSNIRIFLESLLQLEYLLIDKDLLEIKTKYFVIMDIDSQLEISETIFNDPNLRPKYPSAIRTIKDLRDNINLPYFKSIRKEYKEKVFKEDGTRKKQAQKWYSFTSNANNLKFLSQILKRHEEYVIVYLHGSEVTHTSGMLYDVFRLEKGQTFFLKIRSLEDAYGMFRGFVKLTKVAFDIISQNLNEEDKIIYDAEMEKFNNKYIEILKNNYR